MKEENENNLTLSFVKRWIKAFAKLFKKFGGNFPEDNEQFVNGIIADEETENLSNEQREELEEKRAILLEMSEDVDDFYRKKADAEKARSLEDWFNGQIQEFTHDTIPDADENDVNEVKQIISDLQDQEIELKSQLLKDDFISDDEKTFPKEEDKE